MNFISFILVLETVVCGLLMFLLIRSYRKRAIEKKQQQAEAESPYEYCLNILDNFPFPVIIKDINDNFRYKLWNKEAEKQSNTDRNKMVGLTDFEIYGEERGRRYRQIDELLVKEGTAYKTEDDYVTPDGEPHNTIVYKSIFSHGKTKWLLGVRWEITQLKEYEKRLVKANKELEFAIKNQNLVLNSINFGLVYTNLDHIVQWESTSSLDKITKGRRYKAGEICYKTVMGREEPCSKCALNEAIQGRHPVRHEFSEGEHTVEISAIPVYDNAGTELLGGLMKIEDISDKKRIEHLMYEVKKADEANRLKSAFLANMSHEIRTPLNAIVGFSNLLMETNDPDEKREFVHIITTNNELLLQLINDIIDMAKIESGTLDFNYSNSDINSMMDDILHQVQLKNNRREVKIDCIKQASECTINTDQNRVMQVLINFLTNAMKFTNQGNITFGYEKSDKEIYFFVKDSGIGIPENMKEKIFDRFVKLNTFAQGTGLGLPICAMIVEKFNGTIGVDSKEGEGSTFWFRLPIS